MTKNNDYDKITIRTPMQALRYDNFRAFMFDGAELSGNFGFPMLKRSNSVPFSPVPFTECTTKRRKDNKWVHFYIEDVTFERVWNTSRQYLPLLKKFAGVITPDFSLYGDLPKIYQIWNCYRNRTLAYWLQSNKIEIIPSVSWSDKKSFEWCFDGLPTGSTLAVSGNGCYLNPYSRKYFINGFEEMRERLTPKLIVAVGYLPKELRLLSEVLILPGYAQQRAERLKNG